MLHPMDIELFRERTGLGTKQWNGSATEAVRLLVSFRQIKKVTSIQIMSKSYLHALISSIVLEGSENEYPYRNCEIRLGRLDPKIVKVGQTFVEREKCRQLLEELPQGFADYYTTGGFAKHVPMIIHGLIENGEPAVAHYIPPIVEEHRGQDACLIDGIHRNYLIMAVGTTIETIRISNIRYPFPCSIHNWDKVVPVNEKPPREERFNNLRKEFFRNLSWVAIDG